MATAVAIDPTALAVLSIFGGAALTAGAGLIGAAVQARREHRRWLREQRLLAYQRVHQLVERMRYGEMEHASFKKTKAEFTALVSESNIPEHERENVLSSALREMGSDRQTPAARLEWSQRIVEMKIEATSLLNLVGPPEVAGRLALVYRSITAQDWDSHGEALDALENEMRSALGVK